MYIFNRWGEQIFFTKDINMGWNGGYNNGTTIEQEDTYIYVIKVVDFKGKAHNYTGRVTLLK
jgi:gliding motility-associated-like protein